MWKILIIIIICLITSGCSKCVQSHTEIVHHESWIQYVPMNKVLMPIYHNAYDAEEEVCDRYED